MKFVKAILLIFLITTSLSPMKKPGKSVMPTKKPGKIVVPVKKPKSVAPIKKPKSVAPVKKPKSVVPVKKPKSELQVKLEQLKSPLAELRTKLMKLQEKLESLRIFLDPVTEENIWDKIKNLIQNQNGNEFNLKPEIIDEWMLLDNQLGTLKTDMTKIKNDIVIDNEYFKGIRLADYAPVLYAFGDDVNKSNERAVMLFKRLCEKVTPIILDTTPKSCNSIGKRIEQLETHHAGMIGFFARKNADKRIQDLYNKKHDQLNIVSKLIDEIKIGMFNRLQEVFFYLYKGYTYKNQMGAPTPISIIDANIANKKALIENFALQFNRGFDVIDKVFINSFSVWRYTFAGQHNIDDIDSGGIRRVAISDLAAYYNSKAEENGFDNNATREAFPKLIWFLLANMFKPSRDSLLIQAWNNNHDVQFDGFSAIINLPLPFWGTLLSQGSLEISEDDTKNVFTELGMQGAIVGNLKDALGCDTDKETIDELNKKIKLKDKYIQALKLNKILSFEDKVKNMLSRYLASKYHIDEIKKDFWQDANLVNLRRDAGVDEDTLLSTGAFLDNNEIQRHLNNGNVQFLLMRKFLKELNSQHLFNMFNKPPMAQEIKDMIVEGVRQNRYAISSEVTDAITLSETFIRDLFARKRLELQANSTDPSLQAQVLILKAIVWTFNFINENAGDEKEQIDIRTGFVKFVTGQSRPAYMVVTTQTIGNLEAHTCFKTINIPEQLLQADDYNSFKIALIGVVK